MTLKAFLIQFMLIALALSLCADPAEPENRCSNCVPLDILINGTCYTKIKGCLRHIAGPACVECQFGYVFVNSTCIREAVFFGNTNLFIIPPVQILPPSVLTSEEIRNKLGEQYGDSFGSAHEYFLAKYLNELGKGNIKNVSTLQTKTGVFVVILYESDSLKNYEAVSFKDSQNNVKEWSFGLYTGQKRDPVTADTLIRQAQGDKLKDYVIYQLKQEGDILIFDYMNQASDVLRVTVNRNDLNSASLLSKLNSNTLSISDLAIEKIKEIYPAYKNLPATSVKKSDDTYVINFGISISVSFKFSNFAFSINKPLEFPAGAYVSADSSFKGVMINGFTPFNDSSNPQLISMLQYIAKEFPEVTGALVPKVQIQPVDSLSTSAFLIDMKKTNGNTVDQYQFLVWFNKSKLSNMIFARKNNKTIFQEYYNYNVDANFLSNYKIIETGSRVANIPPISSVSFKLLNNRKIFKVIYSPLEFAEFEYQNDTNKVYLLSYYIDGENILDTLSSKRSIAEKRSPDVLLSFIKTQDANASLAQIQEIVYSLPTYYVTYVTNLGTFKAVIEDKGTLLTTSQSAKIGDQTCFDLNVTDSQNGEKVRLFDTFLKQNYPLAGYSIQVIQVNVQTFSLGYRILYANDALKQISITLEEVDGTANVVKVAYSNYGYEVMNPDTLNPDYQKILDIIKQSGFAGSKIPFFTETNGTMVKGYYEDGKSTFQIYYDKKTGKANSQVLATRPYLLIPDGFSFESLLIPGTPSSTDSFTLSRIVQETIKKYTIVVKDAVLVFAEKKVNTFNLMFKSSYGYQRLQAVVSDGKNPNANIVLGKLLVTTYKDSDFSNCRRFDVNGKCLSCDTATEIEFQGACHKRLEGCLVQPGGICVKCDANYVKFLDQKCYRECTMFLQK